MRDMIRKGLRGRDCLNGGREGLSEWWEGGPRYEGDGRAVPGLITYCS